MSSPTDCLIVKVTGDEKRLRLITPSVLSAMAVPVQDWCGKTGFDGAPQTSCYMPADLVDEAGADILIGCSGSPDLWSLAGFAQNASGGSFALVDHLAPDVATLVTLGWVLGQYRFDRYKQSATTQTSNRLLVPEGADDARAGALATATALVRDLVNTPTQDMGPAQIEAAAETLAAEYEATVTTLRGDVLRDAVFPSIHAVGRAAAEDRAPRLIDLRWSGAGGPLITLVGKGVAFDSGGLNIKPANGMRNMKKDMGGAAHVLGLASAIMALRLPCQLRVLIPAVENAIAGNAFRPGDILETRAGISVEVGNTDAEGRLILSDALTYACEEKPDLLIDFATLTGAARVAMGPDIPPVMTDYDDIWSVLEAASKTESDPVWRLPLHEGYRSMLSSSVADMCNISETPFAGSILAGLFLKSFVDDETPWVHFDVFAWQSKATPGRLIGGEAQGMRTALRLIEHWIEKSAVQS